MQVVMFYIQLQLHCFSILNYNDKNYWNYVTGPNPDWCHIHVINTFKEDEDIC